MNKFLKLLSVTAVMASAGVANAGEAGKMYFQVGAGYAMSKDTLTATAAGDNLVNNTGTAYQLVAGTSYAPASNPWNKGFTGGVAFGYYPSDEIRTDLAFNYTSKSATFVMPLVSTATPPVAIANGISWSGKTSDFRVMANVYYDFQTGSAFTPFVTGGIGGAYGSANISDTTLLTALNTTTAPGYVPSGTTTTITSLKTPNKFGFAYTVGFGAAFEVSKGAYIELAYNLSGDTATKTLALVNSATPANTFNYTMKPGLSHSIKAGFRMAF